MFGLDKKFKEALANQGIAFAKAKLAEIVVKVRANDEDKDGLRDYDEEVLPAIDKASEGVGVVLDGVGRVRQGVGIIAAALTPVVQLLAVYWLKYGPKKAPELAAAADIPALTVDTVEADASKEIPA